MKTTVKTKEKLTPFAVAETVISLITPGQRLLSAFVACAVVLMAFPVAYMARVSAFDFEGLFDLENLDPNADLNLDDLLGELGDLGDLLDGLDGLDGDELSFKCSQILIDYNPAMGRIEIRTARGLGRGTEVEIIADIRAFAVELSPPRVAKSRDLRGTATYDGQTFRLNVGLGKGLEEEALLAYFDILDGAGPFTTMAGKLIDGTKIAVDGVECFCPIVMSIDEIRGLPAHTGPTLTAEFVAGVHGDPAMIRYIVDEAIPVEGEFGYTFEVINNAGVIFSPAMNRGARVVDVKMYMDDILIITGAVVRDGYKKGETLFFQYIEFDPALGIDPEDEEAVLRLARRNIQLRGDSISKVTAGGAVVPPPPPPQPPAQTLIVTPTMIEDAMMKGIQISRKLENGLVISINPATITDPTKEINLGVSVGFLTHELETGTSTHVIPANSLIINSAMKGDLGFVMDITIPRSEVSKMTLFANGLRVLHADEKGNLSPKGRIQLNSNGTATLRINYGGRYAAFGVRAGAITGDGDVSTPDALEILKYIVNLPGAIEDSPVALVTALITPKSQSDLKPTTADVMEILKYVVNMDSLVPDVDKLVKFDFNEDDDDEKKKRMAGNDDGNSEETDENVSQEQSEVV